MKYLIWMVETADFPKDKIPMLLEQFGSAKAVFEAKESLLARYLPLKERQKKAIEAKDLSAAENILATCKKQRVRVLSILDSAYPQRLRNIYDPPAVLYIRGNLPDFNSLPAIAVVGQRAATPYGKMAADHLGYHLSNRGVIVVSGMAKGIDGAAHQGAARMLSELKYTFDFVRAERDFSAYKLLILPDGITVNEALAQKLSAFLAKGGKIISTGFSGLTPEKNGFALPEWDFEFVSLDESNTTYFQTEFEAEGIADMPYSTYASGISMKEKEGNRLLASSIASYFKKTGWDGLHYYFYTPPKAKDGNATVLMNAKGNVAHISFPLFTAYFQSFATVFKAMLDKLLSEMMDKRLLLAKELPVSSRATLTDAEDFTLLHVKLTYPEIRGKFGIIEEHNVLPAGRQVGVLGEYTAAYLLPEKTPVTFKTEDGYTYLTLPEIEGYGMFLLEK